MPNIMRGYYGYRSSSLHNTVWFTRATFRNFKMPLYYGMSISFRIIQIQ